MAASSEEDGKPDTAASETDDYEGDYGEEEEEDEDDEIDEIDEIEEIEEIEDEIAEAEAEAEADAELAAGNRPDDGGDSAGSNDSATAVDRAYSDGDGGSSTAATAKNTARNSNNNNNHNQNQNHRRPPLPQHNFAPPFYGRPPTPLPPSPSLTSLLRPSRPTTPDATDDELEPVPRAAPQVPTYEYYGFVLYLFSSLAFLIYLLWSYLPSPFLHGLGIYYYPNRWWSLAIPSFLVISLAYTYVALACYNTEILTLPLNSAETIVDGAAKMAAVDEHGRVVVVGGPDGRRLQGKKSHSGDGAVSSSSSASSSGTSHSNRGTNRGTNSRLHPDAAASLASLSAWSTLPWTSTQAPAYHHRQPSSPSPPLGGMAGWTTAGNKDNKKDKARQGKRGGSRGPPAEDDWGLTMSSGKRSRKNRPDSRHEQGSDQFNTPDWKSLWSEGTDAVMDIPLAGVCEVLYA